MIECGEFMDTLEARGVSFVLTTDGRLKVSAAPGVLTEAQEIELARRWDTIERLVRSAVTPWGEIALAESAGVTVQLTIGEAA